MGGKVSLSCKGKTLLGVVNKLLNTKRLFTSPIILPYFLKETEFSLKVMESNPGYLLKNLFYFTTESQSEGIT